MYYEQTFWMAKLCMLIGLQNHTAIEDDESQEQPLTATMTDNSYLVKTNFCK